VRAPPLRRPLVSALGALVLGVGAGLHGAGAAMVETGIETKDRAELAGRLLPADARPFAALPQERARACRIDPRDPVLARSSPLSEGCEKNR
jgi:hypothetical protein